MAAPRISIITPVYNRQDCIGRCIESVAFQEGNVDFEHIIINDGSTDDTESIILNYKKNNPHIKYFAYTDNKGPNTARNIGIRNANKDYILFLDSDDVLVKNSLPTLCDIIALNIDFDSFLFVNSDKIKASRNIKVNTSGSKIFTHSDFLRDLKLFYIDFVYVFNKNVFNNCLFNENFRIHENLTYLKLFIKTKYIYFQNTTLVQRERGRKDSVTQEYFSMNKQRIETSLNYLYELQFLYRSFADNEFLKARNLISKKIKLYELLNNNSSQSLYYKIIRFLLTIYFKLKKTFEKYHNNYASGLK